jgi:hypothetical protein
MFSGLPIVSKEWVRNIRRRIVADDPQIRDYHTARHIIAEVFGPEWVDENVSAGARADSFFRDASTTVEDAYTHFMRVTALAEMLLNLQHIPGYSECASQLQTAAMIESTFAELEVGKVLYTNRVRFEFNKPTRIKTADFDLRIWCPNGMQAFSDTKCKEEGRQPSRKTIENSLIQARRQLPPRRPGFVFIKVPRRWIEDESYAYALTEIALGFMRTTGRVVSVKFYTTSVVYDAESMGEVIACQEVTTDRTDFGMGINWNLFPDRLTEPDALMLSANWFRLR